MPRFIVTVSDYNVQGVFCQVARRRTFRRLDAARRYETKFCRKALRRQGTRGVISRWGSSVHNFINGGNYSEVRAGHEFNPTRTITITYR